MMDVDIGEIDPYQDEVDSDEEVLEGEGVTEVDEVLAPLDRLKRRVAENRRILGAPTAPDVSTLILSELRDKYPQVIHVAVYWSKLIRCCATRCLHGRGRYISYECPQR